MDIYEQIKTDRGADWTYGYDSDDIEDTESEVEDPFKEDDEEEESENEHGKLFSEVNAEK